MVFFNKLQEFNLISKDFKVNEDFFYSKNNICYQIIDIYCILIYFWINLINLFQEKYFEFDNSRRNK